MCRGRQVGGPFMTGAPDTVSGRRALSLAFVSAAGRAPAFLIPVLIAAALGAGRETDAYFIAYSAALFLGGTLAQGIEQAVVPFAAYAIHRALAPRRYLDAAARRSALTSGLLWSIGVPAFVFIAVAPSMRTAIIRYAIALTPLSLCWCAAAVFTGALVSQWKIGSATGSMLWRGLGGLLG